MNFDTYLSPFSWRYGSPEMRHIFSEAHKYEIWRRIWVALAEVQLQAGLISKKELADLKKHQTEISVERILEIEKETKHDVVAAIREFAEKAKIGGGKIHLGATSMDIVDNTDALRMQEGLQLVAKNLTQLLQSFAAKISETAHLQCMGYTHLQPAEPTTVGYRLAVHAQDLLIDFSLLKNVPLKGKGLKGAVGTRASYVEILQGTDTSAQQLDELVMQKLGIDGALIATQVYPRKYDYLVLTLLASIASSLAKFAADVRLLQSPTIGEWSEPFGKKQVGSSAMPFKKNPINCEKICSLARQVTQLPVISLENATHSYLERTLDDSANKRVIIPEAFLAVDEMMLTALKIISGLVINPERIKFNLYQYGPFAATESILIALVKKGADRQQMHETLREISLRCWQSVQTGAKNPMQELLLENKTISSYFSPKEIIALLDISHHIGDAPQRAEKLVKEIGKVVTNKA